MEKNRNLKQILDDFVKAFPQQGETYEDVTTLLVNIEKELDKPDPTKKLISSTLGEVIILLTGFITDNPDFLESTHDVDVARGVLQSLKDKLETK
tara:strand:- start:200 stop:484 length:285 start_codon:yes stop_codon:yes gene_type:complete